MLQKQSRIQLISVPVWKQQSARIIGAMPLSLGRKQGSWENNGCLGPRRRLAFVRNGLTGLRSQITQMRSIILTSTNQPVWLSLVEMFSSVTIIRWTFRGDFTPFSFPSFLCSPFLSPDGVWVPLAWLVGFKTRLIFSNIICTDTTIRELNFTAVLSLH